MDIAGTDRSVVGNEAAVRRHLETILRCPRCHAPVSWTMAPGACPKCGGPAGVWQGAIPDFVSSLDRQAESILNWPEDAVGQVSTGFGTPDAAVAVGDGDFSRFEALGLVAPDGGYTALGKTVAYHLAERRRQSVQDLLHADVLDEFLRRGAADPYILDVGCGAGQSLPLLTPPVPSVRVGVDSDPVALALGYRLAAGADDIAFVRASAHALPFVDGSFTHVFSRVALNYMHQRTALAEMVRVLRPGGVLCCRVEGPGHDLRRLARAGSPWHVLSHLYDSSGGIILHLTGRQAMPGTRLGGGRAFATIARLREILRQHGWGITMHRTESRFGGLRCSTAFVATQSDSPALPPGQGYRR